MTHRFELEPRSANLAPFRRELRSLLEMAGFISKGVNDILLSVDEVLTNVIRHAYGGEKGFGQTGKIHVAVSDQEEKIEIVIEDKGPCFDPRTLPAPELPSRKPGGLGIYLVKTLMDEIDYEALKPQGNRLRLIKYKNPGKGKGESGR